MALSGAGCRTKGHNFERWVANRLRAVFNGRTIQRGLQTRHGNGETVPDVECPVFWVECKVGARPSPRAALAQAMRDAAKGRSPVAIIKDDRQKPFVVMDFEDWLELTQSWWELTNR